MTVYRYRVHCLTDGKYEYVLASTPPTQCPVNPAHTIDANSIGREGVSVLVNDGSVKNLSLADYKSLRYNEIDYKTNVLISQGFTYDAHTFSLSIPAQLTWEGLKANEADFTWPVDVTTLDHDKYSLAQANLTAFWDAGVAAVKSHLDSGRNLKKSVFDAVDEAAVDAVVDAR